MGGHVNGGVRKPYRFWMYRFLSVRILLVTELRRCHRGHIGEWWKLTLEPADQLRAGPENGRMQFRIGVSQPGGEELLLVADSERSIRQPDQIEVEVVPEQDRRIRGGVEPNRMGYVRVPPLEAALWREDRERVERVPRREPLQDLVSRAERKPSEFDRPVGPGRLDETP